MIPTNNVNKLNLQRLTLVSARLAKSDPMLGSIYNELGAPPLWDRPKGFATLLHIILEQQVSLASAKACFQKLEARIENVSPELLLTLGDSDLRSVGFSSQKAAYARHLSEAVLENRIDLEHLDVLSDDLVKLELMKLKGVGHWTADIYLLMALLRRDVMPKGDLALHIAYQKLTNAGKRPAADEFIAIAEKWRPHRAVAARMLWHFYLSETRKPKRRPGS